MVGSRSGTPTLAQGPLDTLSRVSRKEVSGFRVPGATRSRTPGFLAKELQRALARVRRPTGIRQIRLSCKIGDPRPSIPTRLLAGLGGRPSIADVTDRGAAGAGERLGRARMSASRSDERALVAGTSRSFLEWFLIDVEFRAVGGDPPRRGAQGRKRSFLPSRALGRRLGKADIGGGARAVKRSADVLRWASTAF